MRFFSLTILLLTIVSGYNSYSQEAVETESASHIFWQSNRVINKNDYKGEEPTDPKLIGYCEDLEMCTMAYVGLYSVLDIPKKKRNRGAMLEKVYFAPAFDKNSSYIIEPDSFGVEKQRIIYDIFELSARYAREKLISYQDSMDAYGVLINFFKSVEADALELKDKTVSAFVQDVYIEKKDSAFSDWRQYVDKLLVESKKFETTSEECYRFVKNEPVAEGYIMAETVVGNLFKEE